jgi:serine/threonine protein kinase
MAPEKLTRKDYVGDVSSDMYSLGLVLFEAATGKHPYFEQEYMSAT